MKIEKCDLCGREITPYTKVTLGVGAVRAATGAESVCRECNEAINKVDWDGVARKAIKEAKK